MLTALARRRVCLSQERSLRICVAGPDDNLEGMMPSGQPAGRQRYIGRYCASDCYISPVIATTKGAQAVPAEQQSIAVTSLSGCGFSQVKE